MFKTVFYLLFSYTILLGCTSLKNKKNTSLLNTFNTTLVAPIKNINEIELVKSLIINSGLKWSKPIINKGATKIVLIDVPSNRTSFWITHLHQTNQFKSVQIYTEDVLARLLTNEQALLVTLRKTPCFGHCPSYEVTINTSGDVIYKGHNYVLKKGLTKFRLAEKRLEAFKKKIISCNVDSLSKEYNINNIADLSTTHITIANKQVIIKSWKNVPDSLINIITAINIILTDEKLIK